MNITHNYFTGQLSFWSISKLFEAIRWYGWMNGLMNYYDLVSGQNRTFFNATTIIKLNKNISRVNFDSYYRLNRPLRFRIYLSHVGKTSFTLTVDMFNHQTNETYGRCDSKIVYTDAKTRRPVKLPDYLVEGFKDSIEKLQAKHKNIEKLGEFDIPNGALTSKVKVLHGDCDRNLHVNQSTYPRWCSDVLYPHLIKLLDLKNMRETKGIHMNEMVMQYLGEALVNEIITVYMWQKGNHIFFAFVSERGKQIFNAKLSLHESVTLGRDNAYDISSKL